LQSDKQIDKRESRKNRYLGNPDPEI